MEILQPKLRFPEFEGDWKLKKLSDTIKSIDSGWSPQCEDYSSDINEWGVLKTTSVVWEGFNENENKKLPIKLKPKENIEVVANDILITRAGPTNRVGVSVHVDRVRPKLMLSDKLIRLRTNENYSSKFISILLSLENIKNQIVSKSSGLATSQTNISQNILLNVKLSVPLFHEQTKIANFLSSIDEKINLLKEKKALLEAYKKGMMQKIFNQEIRFKDDNGNDFEDWEENNLGALCKITTGKLDANAMVYNGKYRFYTCAKDYYKIDKYAFDTEALLISGNGANVGYIHYYKGKFNAYQRTYILDDFKENINYIKYFLQMNLPRRIKGEKNDGNTPYIVLSTLSEMDFLIPCLEEQTKIANFLSAIDEKIALLATQIKDTQEYKKGLLQQMFI